MRLAFFAPTHDPRLWLDGWYPETLGSQYEAVKATDLKPYWSCCMALVLEINPCCDPFRPQKLWTDMRNELGDRVTTVMIDDASHALSPEQLDSVADEILE